MQSDQPCWVMAFDGCEHMPMHIILDVLLVAETKEPAEQELQELQVDS
jgi:hypothetical protein